jgi:alcohol dehydrogenase
MALLALGEVTYPFFAPRLTLMGLGCSKEAGAQAKALGAAHVLLVTDKVLNKLGMVQQIRFGLESAGLKVTVFDGVEPNPTDKNVHEGASIYRENQCDALVSLGGGSSHDCAKGIGVVVSHGGQIGDYVGMNLLKKPLPPLMAINTTAGTGSECTRMLIITNTVTHAKMLIGDARCAALVAINDPKLMADMPPALTAATGMDALTHAVEAYASTMATPLTDACALQAIRLIGTWLRPAVANGANMQARDKMAYAEYMAGLAFSNGRLGAVHAMAQSLGSVCDLPHGVCCAILLPWVCESNLMAVPERYAEIAIALGENVDGLSILDAAAKTSTAIRRLNKDIGMPSSLAETGSKDVDVEMLAKSTMNEVALKTNPRSVTYDQVLGMFKAALGPNPAKAATR